MGHNFEVLPPVTAMTEIFSSLDSLPPDPILGVAAAFRADPSPQKVDLGVGVYRDDRGQTPMPEAVKRAAVRLAAEQQTKTYVGPAGNLEFNRLITELALGELAQSHGERLAVIQSVGGCGALRLGAELVRVATPGSVVHVSDPTWANHQPLLGSSGLALEPYPYYDPQRRRVDFERMRDHVRSLPARSVLLLHACCHNPTGADLTGEQWREIGDIVVERGLVPFVDLAYQGFAESLEHDVAGLRSLAARVPEMLLAVSCSKNFGLYRERAGALIVLAANAATAAAVATHQARTARRMYSMPPDHGAAIAAMVLGDGELRELWQAELESMVARMKSLRALLASRLNARRRDLDFGWLAHQTGMFSLLGLDAGAITRLREERHVYVPPDGRMNVAGINDANVDYVADSIAGLLA
jgi:aspartate aminotransferase